MKCRKQGDRYVDPRFYQDPIRQAEECRRADWFRACMMGSGVNELNGR